MSLMELYSAMVAQASGRASKERSMPRLEGRSAIGQAAQPMVVAESQRIRALELENAEIKAGFSAFVNLLMKKGVIEHGDLEAMLKIPGSTQAVPVVSSQPTESTYRSPSAPSGKKRKRRRR
jgi:hypothetical protein